MLDIILENIAIIIEAVSYLAAGTTSVINGYQPELPKRLYVK